MVRYPLLCLQDTAYPVLSFSTLTILADLCVMASVLLHGLPLLPPLAGCGLNLWGTYQNLTLQEGGGGIKAKGGQCKIKAKRNENASKQAKMRDR